MSTFYGFLGLRDLTKIAALGQDLVVTRDAEHARCFDGLHGCSDPIVPHMIAVKVEPKNPASDALVTELMHQLGLQDDDFEEYSYPSQDPRILKKLREMGYDAVVGETIMIQDMIAVCVVLEPNLIEISNHSHVFDDGTPTFNDIPGHWAEEKANG